VFLLAADVNLPMECVLLVLVLLHNNKLLSLLKLLLKLNNKINNIMMLLPRLNNCINCATIPVLINDINVKIASLATEQYNDIIYQLNNYINGQVIFDLLQYKQILEWKFCNADYCAPFTVEMIASKVKILINK
jgi:hypothetical protein